MNMKEKELENLLEDDEIYWKQRARENWLNWGDNNTRWFHMKASNCRKVNRIHGLFDTNGEWVEEDHEMESVANQYSQDLFQSTSPQLEVINQILEAIPNCLTVEQNLKLIAPFMREETHGVVRGMHPTKASGPDGIHTIFYQKYWDVVGKDISDFCLQFLNGE